MLARYVALLRAVNVGGTGKLLMADLKSLCVDAGFQDVETYIASGNVVFSSKVRADIAQSQLEQFLRRHTGKPVGVILRTAQEMQAVLTANPFGSHAPNRTYCFFLPGKPPKNAIEGARLRKGREPPAGHARDLRSLPVRHGPVAVADSGRG